MPLPESQSPQNMAKSPVVEDQGLLQQGHFRGCSMLKDMILKLIGCKKGFQLEWLGKECALMKFKDRFSIRTITEQVHSCLSGVIVIFEGGLIILAVSNESSAERQAPHSRKGRMVPTPIYRRQPTSIRDCDRSRRWQYCVREANVDEVLGNLKLDPYKFHALLITSRENSNIIRYPPV